jgi:hypothetical protein
MEGAASIGVHDRKRNALDRRALAGASFFKRLSKRKNYGKLESMI